jgi:hypothetical protein
MLSHQPIPSSKSHQIARPNFTIQLKNEGVWEVKVILHEVFLTWAKLSQPTILDPFFIKEEELAKKGWTVNSPELHAFIENKLIKILVWDFNLTLGNVHSWSGGEGFLTTLKGGMLAKDIIAYCASRRNIFPAVITHGLDTVVNNNLENWGIKKYFKKIITRKDFPGYPHTMPGANRQDKEYFLQNIMQELLNNSALDESRYLQLDKSEDSIISVISMTLIEDENLEEGYWQKSKHYAKNGITLLSVDASPYEINHLTTINLSELDNIFLNEIKKRNVAKNILSLWLECQNLDESSFLSFDGEVIDYANMWYFYTKKFKSILENLSPTEVVDVLLDLLEEICIHINQPGYNQHTLLHFFAAIKDENAIIKLIENGADINFADEWGTTPLHLLGRYDEEGALKMKFSFTFIDFLISNKVNFELEDSQNLNFLDLLLENSSNENVLEMITYLYSRTDLKISLEKLIIRNSLPDQQAGILYKFYNKFNVKNGSGFLSTHFHLWKPHELPDGQVGNVTLQLSELNFRKTS